MAFRAFGTLALAAELGRVRENYRFGFGPVALEMPAGCPRGNVQLASGKVGLMVGALG